jgi:hypothetical protein
MFRSLLHYLVSDPEMALDIHEGVKAFQSLVYESQRRLIMGFVLSMKVELHENRAALYCLVENTPLGRGWSLPNTA